MAKFVKRSRLLLDLWSLGKGSGQMMSARGRQFASAVLSLAMVLVVSACSQTPDPAGSGGQVGHLSGTSDVAGQPGDPAIGGGGLAVIPIGAMDGRFWDLTGQEELHDPQQWAHVVVPLSQAQVAKLGGSVVPIDDDGDFRITVAPGDYAVCRWPEDVGGALVGCDVIELSGDGELEASVGEAGFHIRRAE